MYITDSVTLTAQWEGVVAWMYLDTATPPNVTAGCGMLLATASDACAFPFQLASGVAATAAEITADFTRVKALPGSKLPAFYRAASSVLLPDSFIQAHIRTIIEANDRSLAQYFTNYATMPDSAKLVLLDMTYNLGFEGLVTKFPKFCTAVKASDWATAAANCHRGGIGADRNTWAATQFTAL